MTFGVNGGVIGPANVSTKQTASGVWSLGEIAEAERDGIWPEKNECYVLAIGKTNSYYSGGQENFNTMAVGASGATYWLMTDSNSNYYGWKINEDGTPATGNWVNIANYSDGGSGGACTLYALMVDEATSKAYVTGYAKDNSYSQYWNGGLIFEFPLDRFTTSNTGITKFYHGDCHWAQQTYYRSMARYKDTDKFIQLGRQSNYVGFQTYDMSSTGSSIAQQSYRLTSSNAQDRSMHAADVDEDDRYWMIGRMDNGGGFPQVGLWKAANNNGNVSGGVDYTCWYYQPNNGAYYGAAINMWNYSGDTSKRAWTSAGVYQHNGYNLWVRPTSLDNPTQQWSVGGVGASGKVFYKNSGQGSIYFGGQFGDQGNTNQNGGQCMATDADGNVYIVASMDAGSSLSYYVGVFIKMNNLGVVQFIRHFVFTDAEAFQYNTASNKLSTQATKIALDETKQFATISGRANIGPSNSSSYQRSFQFRVPMDGSKYGELGTASDAVPMFGDTEDWTTSALYFRYWSSTDTNMSSSYRIITTSAGALTQTSRQQNQGSFSNRTNFAGNCNNVTSGPYGQWLYPNWGDGT